MVPCICICIRSEFAGPTSQTVNTQKHTTHHVGDTPLQTAPSAASRATRGNWERRTCMQTPTLLGCRGLKMNYYTGYTDYSYTDGAILSDWFISQNTANEIKTVDIINCYYGDTTGNCWPTPYPENIGAVVHAAATAFAPVLPASSLL